MGRHWNLRPKDGEFLAKSGRVYPTPATRIAASIRIDPLTGCHTWTRSIADGYGVMSVDGKTRRVHRVAYELASGPVPNGLELDHTCRNRACCNPDHLEPVTTRENIRRSPFTFASINAAKESCCNGHPFTPENTGWHGPRGQWRQCIECRREAARRRPKQDRTEYLARYYAERKSRRLLAILETR